MVQQNAKLIKNADHLEDNDYALTMATVIRNGALESPTKIEFVRSSYTTIKTKARIVNRMNVPLILGRRHDSDTLVESTDATRIDVLGSLIATMETPPQVTSCHFRLPIDNPVETAIGTPVDVNACAIRKQRNLDSTDSPTPLHGRDI